jgi:hypothetical protein
MSTTQIECQIQPRITRQGIADAHHGTRSTTHITGARRHEHVSNVCSRTGNLCGLIPLYMCRYVLLGRVIVIAPDRLFGALSLMTTRATRASAQSAPGVPHL